MTDFQTVLSGTGWEPVLSLCYPPGGLEIIWIWVTKLRRVLDLIKYQNLSKLESLVLNASIASNCIMYE
ncbi:hypothetical protein FBU30_009333 [Linnemannia zychae]|nr:hypothetical protein FBU30_009333 [Linnemannia zychae]